MQHFIEARAMQARKHDLAHHNGDVDRYENFSRNTRTATAVAKHAHAQNNGHNRANARKSDLNYGDNEGRRVDRRSGITSKRRQVEAKIAAIGIEITESAISATAYILSSSGSFFFGGVASEFDAVINLVPFPVFQTCTAVFL